MHGPVFERVMIEKYAYRTFITFMLLTASSALVLIWMGEEGPMPEQLVPTFFVVGLAAFLIWASIMVYRFYAVLSS